MCSSLYLYEAHNFTFSLLEIVFESVLSVMNAEMWEI